MLKRIEIRDFALIEHLDIELQSGMTVVTGETGAGKSIIVDALNLALGDRADSSTVRHQADRAEITLEFDISELPGARSTLTDNDLDDDSECVVRRVVTREGRSKSYINGRQVSGHILKEIGEPLVDIYGQHEHQSLLRHDMQYELLDEFAQHRPLAEQVKSTFSKCRSLKSELNKLRTAAADRQARLELLRYQVNEMNSLELSPNELDELEKEHDRLANAEQLIATCQQSMWLLEEAEQQAVAVSLAQVARQLENMAVLDAGLQSIVELIASAHIQVQEAANDLRHYVDNLDVDTQRFAAVEQRLSAIHEIARKHRIPAAELPALTNQLTTELAAIETADERVATVENELRQAELDYCAAASALTEKRREAAPRLSQQVSEIIQQLGMPGARFTIELTPQEQDTPAANGQEQIEFMVSTNPGQPFKALGKVASGGELSRICLAIRVVTANVGGVSTLIFDEVDTGVGGRVAEIIGQQLRLLGKTRQVLCVTHLPQVAALGHNHLHVAKHTQDGATRTAITTLPEAARYDEIARMLGGVEITPQTKALAQEMVARGKTIDRGAKARRNRIDATP